jgi:flagellar biogenesis protein FliO
MQQKGKKGVQKRERVYLVEGSQERFVVTVTSAMHQKVILCSG